MNALSKIEHSPASQAEWIDRGRALVGERVEIDWRIADWMAEGKEAGHLSQTKFDFLSENLGLAPKRLKDALKAAMTFPPALRDASLSVEHHAAVANLPKDEALPLLVRASTEHMQVQDLREAVTQRRYETGQIFTDDDLHSTFLTLLVRQWNRSPPEAQELFVELLRAVRFMGVIDEDQAYDEEA